MSESVFDMIMGIPPIYSMAFVGYMLGGIPFGLILTKLWTGRDIRQIGSGNIGATNVLRTGNKGLALAVVLLDMAKAAFAVIIGRSLFNESAALIGGAFAVIGHNFPFILKFRGGKGVASTVGMTVAFSPLTAAFAGALWLFVAVVGKRSSLAALVMLAALPIIAFILTPSPFVFWVFAALSILGIIRHHANIMRLLKGDEPKIKI